MNETVYVAGAFDLFHLGHLNYLEQAAALGDRLIVGVMTDEFRQWGSGEVPILPIYHRLRIIAALSCVDFALPINSMKDEEQGLVFTGVTIRGISPTYGWHPEHIPLRKRMEAIGIKYVAIPRTPNISTTTIKEKCRNGTG